MIKKNIFCNILKSLAITALTMWLVWSIPFGAGLEGIVRLGFIMIIVPIVGTVFFILNYLKLRRLKDVNIKTAVLFSLLLLVIVPLPLGFFTSASISNIERHYYSSDKFIENYSDKHGFNAQILNRKATFAQCSLLKYAIEFEITTNSDSVLVFDAQNITETGKTNFVDNLKVILDSKFEPKPGLNTPGLTYVVPEGGYSLEISSSEPFTLSVMDSNKLISTRSLSGEDVYALYAPILQDSMSYQQFILQTQNTKDTTCKGKGTPRKYGSYWFANEHVVVGDVGISQDKTHTLLYLAGYTPKLHFATILTKDETRDIASGGDVVKPYKIVVNKYTGQQVPIFTSERFEQQLSQLGKMVNQMIEKNAIFPEPLRFPDVKVFFEPIELGDVDKVIQVIENMEPAFYAELLFE